MNAPTICAARIVHRLFKAAQKLSVLALVGLLFPLSRAASAQEMVPVPKSRLEELERAEQELRQLKGQIPRTNDLALRTNDLAALINPPMLQTNDLAVQTNKAALQTNNLAPFSNPAVVTTPAVVTSPAVAVAPREDEVGKLKAELSRAQEQNLQLQKQHEADAAKMANVLAAEPVIVHISPPMSSLPPLQPSETVDAMDLANYYRADPGAADQRFRNKSFLVRGEVTRFEKSLIVRDYKIVLKTADREIKVICAVFPPEAYKSVFPVKDGTEMVGLTAQEARVHLVKVGDTVLIGGQCKGLRNSLVTISGCELKAIRQAKKSS